MIYRKLKQSGLGRDEHEKSKGLVVVTNNRGQGNKGTRVQAGGKGKKTRESNMGGIIYPMYPERSP